MGERFPVGGIDTELVDAAATVHTVEEALVIVQLDGLGPQVVVDGGGLDQLPQVIELLEVVEPELPLLHILPGDQLGVVVGVVQQGAEKLPQVLQRLSQIIASL